jgi:hypothetical protein
MIHNFKWKRTPLRALLLQGSFDLTITPARNLLAPYMMPSMVVPPPSRANPTRKGIA